MKKRFLSWFVAYLATAVTVQAAPTVNFGYDTVGRLQSRTTALGFQNSFNYDSFSRLRTVTFPSGQGSAGYQYNGQDTPIQVTDPRGLVTAYDADGLGQVGGLTSPDTGITQNTYDEAGNLTKRILAGGQTVSFSYDAVDRITSVSASDFSTNFEYDSGAVGQLTGMTDDAGRTIWTYDTKGRVATKTQVIDGRTWAVGYGWQGDILTQLTYPSGRVVTFAVDHGRITSVAVDGQAALTGVTYLAMGGVSGWTMGAAGNYVRNFDVHGRVTGYTGPEGQRTLTLDDDNRVTDIKEASGVVVGGYGYDSMGRLTSATEGGVVRTYAYDLNGNRTQLSFGGASYSIDIATSSNQISFASLPNAGATSYDHDTNGNLTSNGRATLQWNSLGYATNAATNSGSVEFSYNGFGQRVRKSAGATGTRYYVYAEDNQTLLGEYDATGQPVAEYVYLEGLPALVLKPTGTYFVQADHLGTPRGIKNGAGELVWRWDADAFGNGVPNDDLAGAGAFESNLRFPGQLFDRETGLHYNNARYYDPAVGRYISSDPIGLEGGLNTYSYVNGQPTRLVDISGKSPLALGAGVALIAGGLAVQGIIYWHTTAQPGAYGNPPNSPGAGWLGSATLAIHNATQAVIAHVSGTATATGTQSTCQGIKDVYLNSAQYPETASHITDAIKAGQPAIVTLDKDIGRTKARRQAALRASGLPSHPVMDRDEWPMAMFMEGGATASVRYVHHSDNRGAGSIIGQQCRPVPNGCKIRLIVQ